MQFREGCTGNASSTGAWVWHYWDHLGCHIFHRQFFCINLLTFFYPKILRLHKFAQSKILHINHYFLLKALDVDLWESLTTVVGCFLEEKSRFMGKLDFCCWKFVCQHIWRPRPLPTRASRPSLCFFLTLYFFLNLDQNSQKYFQQQVKVCTISELVFICLTLNYFCGALKNNLFIQYGLCYSKSVINIIFSHLTLHT